jgi:hypothetical protein
MQREGLTFMALLETYSQTTPPSPGFAGPSHQGEGNFPLLGGGGQRGRGKINRQADLIPKGAR